jgi:riboflavin kinase / FMN adenylyltransferase
VERWRGLEDVPPDWGPSVVTIGVFDGVHRGHQRLVGQAVACGRELDLPVVVVTFDPHPSEVVRPGTHPAMLSTQKYRAELLAREGVDAVCVLPFTLEFSRLSPEDFVEHTLLESLHAAAVVVGENFRFGHRAAGDVALLTELGERFGFSVRGVGLVTEEDGGDGVSSTHVRELVAAGDVEAALRALGRPHRVEGTVVRGEQRGRELGYPTANLECPPYTAIPDDGVYAGWLQLGPRARPTPGERLPAAISVGTNPTFDGEERRVEAYALDRTDLDLYGDHVAVDFLARIREMIKFESIITLVEQMADDVERTRVLIAKYAEEKAAGSGAAAGEAGDGE